MFKALLKKQLLETMAFFFLNNKDGKKRSKFAVFGFGALMIYVLGTGVVMFWLLSAALCENFVALGLDWVYFAFLSILATAIGVIGSVFATKTKLYEAKDNELLLSMPVPPWMILFARMLGLYGLTLFIQSIVLIPAMVQYFITVTFSFAPFLFCLLLLALLPLGTLAICCLLGFLIALITAKLPAKNLFTIIGFLVFFVVYFLAYSKLNEYLVYVLENGEAIGEGIKGFFYPFWQVGLAMTGDPLAFLIVALMMFGGFALVYWILSVSYLRIVTMRRGERQAKYKEREQKSSSADSAFLKKEVLRFLKSPAYLINCSLGTICMAIVGVLSVVNDDLFGFNKELVSSVPALSESFGLIVVLLVCLLVSMNVISAPSVSLEGENIWIAQSLPVSGWLILKAKLKLHFYATAIFLPVLTLIIALVMGLDVFWAIAIVLTGALFVLLTAALGLILNLKFPNLHWTNETAAVKQGMSVLFSMFANWGILILFVGGYFLFGKMMLAELYLCFCVALLIAGTILCVWWLKYKGSKIFERLR